MLYHAPIQLGTRVLITKLKTILYMLYDLATLSVFMKISFFGQAKAENQYWIRRMIMFSYLDPSQQKCILTMIANHDRS